MQKQLYCQAKQQKILFQIGFGSNSFSSYTLQILKLLKKIVSFQRIGLISVSSPNMRNEPVHIRGNAEQNCVHWQTIRNENGAGGCLAEYESLHQFQTDLCRIYLQNTQNETAHTHHVRQKELCIFGVNKNKFKAEDLSEFKPKSRKS
jgi:hypothetical protein